MNGSERKPTWFLAVIATALASGLIWSGRTALTFVIEGGQRTRTEHDALRPLQDTLDAYLRLMSLATRLADSMIYRSERLNKALTSRAGRHRIQLLRDSLAYAVSLDSARFSPVLGLPLSRPVTLFVSAILHDLGDERAQWSGTWPTGEDERLRVKMVALEGIQRSERYALADALRLNTEMSRRSQAQFDGENARYLWFLISLVALPLCAYGLFVLWKEARTSGMAPPGDASDTDAKRPDPTTTRNASRRHRWKRKA